MSFLYPLGLLGLIGIPILIIIYIIKSKYTEQTVSSTYLWTLSEKFLKRKKPISKLTGIISLILQILTVVFVSFSIAHPIVVLPDIASEYCFILDATGSMNIEKDGKTRFEKGKEEISALIKQSADGSTYSLVYVGSSTSVVFEGVTNKDQALFLLQEKQPAFTHTELTDAIGLAQGMFDKNPSLVTYLITDESYEKETNVNVINVAAGESNVCVTDVTYTLSGGTLKVNGNILSYSDVAEGTVGLYVDGESTLKDTATVALQKGEAAAFELSTSAQMFHSLQVTLSGTDALALDDTYIIYNEKSESSYHTLLVSATPFFLQSALQSVLTAKIDVVTPEEYKGQTGYGLYIFDCYNPTSIPTDGAVWFINPTASTPDTGFSVQGEVVIDGADVLTLTNSSSSVAKKFMQDLVKNDVYVTEYVQCGLYSNFTTLFSYKGHPVIFAGANSYGNREVVFAFDLHKSNLPVLYDYIVMMRNLIDYSFPEIVEKTDYYCGEEVTVNALANCDSIRVDTPLGNVTFLDAETATNYFTLDEVGVYTVTMTMGQQQKSINLYSAMAKGESNPAVSQESIEIQGQASAEKLDGLYDTLTLLVILLACVFFADWGVYCYEKHQLR